MQTHRRPALDDDALTTAQRGLWAVCIAIYLIVFVGGIAAGGAELLVMARAMACTLVAALLGRTVLGLLRQASLPIEQGPSANQDGPLGSLVDLTSSTNVAAQENEAEAA